MEGTMRTAPASHKNVGDNERRVSLLGGAASVLWGLSRGGLPGLALAGLGTALIYRGASGYCPMYARMGHSSADASDRGLLGRGRAAEPVHLHSAITIDKDPRQLFDFWRDFSRLPQIMQHLLEVRPLEGGRSHWVAQLPMGRRLEWDAEITEEIPGERIAWRSLPGADVDSEGEVRFRAGPQGRGTEVEVDLRYRPPGGAAGMAARFVGGLSETLLREDLRRFKRVMEAGEVPTAALVH